MTRSQIDKDTVGGGITELTTDVVAGPGTGSQVATIANDAVTYAKMQNANANTVIARAAATNGDLGEVALAASELVGRGSAGNVAPIALGTNLSMSGNTLNASSSGGITELTTDVVAGPGSGTQVATIANDAVTYAKMQNASANTVIARAAATGGDLGEVALSASQLLGRGVTGDVAPIILGTNLSMSGTTLNAANGNPFGIVNPAIPVITLAPGDGNYTILIDNTSFVGRVFLPQASTATGYVYNIKRMADASVSNHCEINPFAGDLIEGETVIYLYKKWESYTIQSDGANRRII